jgi:monomeric isocitrate dehydrogenase
MKDLKWLSKSDHDISCRYLKSTMCVMGSLAMVVSDAGVTGAEVRLEVGADSRMSAMLGNMWKSKTCLMRW